MQKRHFTNNQNSINLNETNDVSNDDNISSSNTTTCSMYKDYLKNQVNLAELKLDVLNSEVESGQQRAEFKLTPFTSSADIPMSKYFIDNKQDLSTIYHRKMLQRIQQYATRMKSIDIKTMVSVNLDEIKKEHNLKLQELSNKFNDEKEELNERIKQEISQKEGYAQSIDYLSSYMKVVTISIT